MKTKLGISVGLFGAALYFTAFFSSYMALILLAGYVLLMEENLWLKQTAVKAFALMLAFSILSAVIGFIPDTISLLNSVLSIFNSTISLDILDRIISVLNHIISYGEKVLFLVLGFMALKLGTIKIGPIDNLVAKHFMQIQG